MNSPITELKGVGKKVADKLAQLNIFSMQDLLFHLPTRYEDRTKITPIASIAVSQSAVVQGRVIKGNMQFGKRRSFVCQIDDGSGVLTVRLFYFAAPQIKNLSTPGVVLRLFGAIKVFGGKKEVVHPEYQVIDESNPLPLSNRLTPVYPTTDGVTQSLLKKLISQVITSRLDDSIDLLPAELINKQGMIKLGDALRIIHSPLADDNVQQCIDRLALEELLAHQLSVKSARITVKQKNGYVVNKSKVMVPKLLTQLPFTLTGAQKKVFGEIVFDMSSGNPMMRLVQGDVGSGKTIVALMSALNVVEEQMQVAVMAPTEILAEQHLKNFGLFCDSLSISIAWLSGSVKGKKRKEELEKIESGEAQIIVGTHALFQADVHYKKLGLVIIDEQHRFGVHQRLALFYKGKNNHSAPHQLVMTATPIPRSLAMTAYADLDCSIIDELPPGRTNVTTVALDNHLRDKITQRIRKIKELDQQIYWVCTLIDESENLQCQAAEKTKEDLQIMLPEFNIGLVHGRMKPKEKDEVMNTFKNKNYDVLVATTVIEVGVDVPNATLMVIENAERLGLSQLHQLRGRVGRGAKKSYCILLYQNPLNEFAKQRLSIMRETNDGFKIANQDLLMRGPGELLGTRQTGEMNFKIANLLRDQDLLPIVHQIANEIIQSHPNLIDGLIKRWQVTESDYAKV